MIPIAFFSEEIEFEPSSAEGLVFWLAEEAEKNGFQIGGINYIFCSDEYLLGLNRQYLQHDYYTDILTFPHQNSDQEGLWADIFISVDRVRENAKEVNSTFEDELHRVMIHGLLHLMGWQDQDHDAKEEMRKAENQALERRKL